MSNDRRKPEPKRLEDNKQPARACAVCGHVSPAQHTTCPRCGCADWLNNPQE